MSDLRFDGRVALVTGAGNGLGRSHALLLASRGCKVVVNDLGGGHTGGGKSSAAADKVVQEIKEAGGEAIANYDSVEDGDKIVKTALDAWGRIDVVINNAGILRDSSFQKMSQEDWDLIYRVHVLGAYRVTRAAWEPMREQGFGRVLFTASAAGIYGNFGQANYSMAKLGIHGFAQTLALEGKKRNIFSNTIAPIAGSRMTETVLPPELIEALKPEYVSPLAAWLCHESCEENGSLFEVGGGYFAKLRWERTEGKMFRPGRAITPEAVKGAWGEVTDFSRATHPANVTDALGPVIANSRKKSLGGNELIDLDLALGYEFPAETSSYDERDLALYALGIGHAKDPNDESELKYVYEGFGKGFAADPTFAVIPAIRLAFEHARRGIKAPGINYGFDRVLHGEQYTELKRPLPPHAKLTHKARIRDIFDKGKNALVITEFKSYDENGEELIHNELTTFVRGAGGWGGDRGPSVEQNVPPDRAPDAVTEEKIPENQTLLYRLSGDVNPLHVDPDFARAFGFERPILHGLCTFGYAGRHVIKAFARDEPGLFRSIKVRFSESVFPGETLITEMWKESDEKIVFRCKVKERDKVVISSAAVQLHKEVPKARPRPAVASAPASAPSASAPSGAPVSSDIVRVIEDHVTRNAADLTSKVNASFVFYLTDPASSFSIDLRQGQGKVAVGPMDSPDCTLELSDRDFLDMTSGKADPQKLYFGGKLKIGGNVMASQKLTFLKKIDLKAAEEAIKKARASAPKGGAAEVGAPRGREARASAIFEALSERLARSPELVAEVGAVLGFRITGPDGVWTVDLKNGSGAVKAGEIASVAADATLTLSDEDLAALTRGEDARGLFQRGRIRIDGDVAAAKRLGFLRQLA